MESENETVAEVREDVHEYLTSIGPGEYPDETQFEEFADRFVAAHKCEMDEVLKDRNEMYKSEMADNIVRCAIEEWNIKDRRWAIVEECDASKKRMMKMRYKVLCARYPNNSIRLVELTEVVADSRIVNRDAEEFAR